MRCITRTVNDWDCTLFCLESAAHRACKNIILYPKAVVLHAIPHLIVERWLSVKKHTLGQRCDIIVLCNVNKRRQHRENGICAYG